MWRATFFVYFNRSQLLNSFFGGYLPDSLDCDELKFDDSLESKIYTAIEKKISIFQSHHIQTVNLCQTQSSKEIIWMATVKAPKEESETCVENREKAQKDFVYIARQVAYKFNLSVDGPHCNVSWTWIV